MLTAAVAEMTAAPVAAERPHVATVVETAVAVVVTPDYADTAAVITRIVAPPVPRLLRSLGPTIRFVARAISSATIHHRSVTRCWSIKRFKRQPCVRGVLAHPSRCDTCYPRRNGFFNATTQISRRLNANCRART